MDELLREIDDASRDILQKTTNGDNIYISQVSDAYELGLEGLEAIRQRDSDELPKAWTEEQKAQLKAIHEKSKAQIAPKIKQLTEIEYELDVLQKKEFTSNTFGVKTLENVKLSGKTVEQLQTEAKKLRGEIREIKKAQFEASQAVFTEEQKQELKKMKEEHAKYMKKHKHAKKFEKSVK